MKQKLMTKKSGLAFVIIFSSLIASSLIGYSQQKGATTQAITEIQKSYSSVISSGTDEQNMPQRIQELLDTTPKTKGDMGELERFMKIFINKLASQNNDYQLELEAIGWQKILDPERINQDASLIESKITIRNAKNIVKKYKAKTFNLLENAREDIGKANVSEELRQQMQIGFNKGMEESGTQIEAIWDLEERTISEFGNIIALLSARKNTWVIENGQIMFTYDKDLKSFNYHISTIQELVEKEEAMQKRGLDVLNHNFDKAKEFVK